MELNPKEKIKCTCSQYISRRGMERHLLSKSHINATVSKVNNKLTKFNHHKDEYSCCHKCYRTKIAYLYFNESTNICNTCNEIELNQDRLCRYCNTTKNISLFERPYLTRCKRCAANSSAIKVKCDICNKICDKGSIAKHKKMHNN